MWEERQEMHLRQITSALAWVSLSNSLAPQGAEPKYRRRKMPRKLAPFVEVPDKALNADGHHTRHERRTARALHVELRA